MKTIICQFETKPTVKQCNALMTKLDISIDLNRLVNLYSTDLCDLYQGFHDVGLQLTDMYEV